MTYGLNRALPMAVIGFLAGAGFVILLRGLQSMDVLWHPQIGLIIGGLVSAIFFLWGIGAWSPAMGAHNVVEPEEDEFGNELPVEDHHHHDEETPRAVLSSTIWTIAFWTMVIFAGLLIFAALPGGFGYTLSTDPAANANALGFFPIDLGNGETLMVSKLVAFILFVALTMFSLFVAAGLIAGGLFGLNRGVKEVKAVGNQPLTGPALADGTAVAALPSGEVVVEQAPRRTARQRVTRFVIMAITFVVLYWVFYEVAIGFVLPQPYWLRIIVSLVNVIIVMLIIFSPKWLLFTVGRIARFTARVLRGIPAFLFQRD